MFPTDLSLGFAVIPTLGVGGPLAILALLVPSLFGGALLLLRQWLAFLTTVSACTAVLLMHSWMEHEGGSWLRTDSALWWLIAGVLAVGVLWTWARPAGKSAPLGTENMVLFLSSLLCLGVVLLYAFVLVVRDASWYLFLSFAVAMWTCAAWRAIATILKLSRVLDAVRSEESMLWVSLIAWVSFGLVLGVIG